MGLWQTVIGKLAGGVIQQQVDVRVRESLQLAGFLQEDWGWTRISEGRSTRDLQPLHHEQMIALALYAYDRNPLGKWTLEMTRDLICAEGITVASEDDAISEVLKAFWDFPINNLDLNLPQMILELGLFGEQCWPVFAGETGGTMALGLVDPADIKSVIHDPDNCAVPIGVVLKDRGEGEGPKFKVIYDRPDAELFAAKARQMRDEQFTDGETFWWRLNGVRSATRGRSDLFVLNDWLDGYERFLLYTLDRTALLNAMTWDVTLEGMDDAQVAAWLKANPRPDPGSWFAHNERVKLAAITPNLGANDAADHGRMIRNHILGAAGYPEHWFGGGGDVNRSTSESMSIPTFKRYLQRQRLVKYIVERLCHHQLELAREASTLRSDDLEFTVNMPQMVTQDLTGIFSALTQLTSAAQIAEDRGWIDAGTSARLFAALASRSGEEVTVDPQAVNEEANVTPDYRRNGRVPQPDAAAEARR